MRTLAVRKQMGPAEQDSVSANGGIEWGSAIDVHEKGRKQVIVTIVYQFALD